MRHQARPQLIGESAAMRRLRAEVAQVAASDAKVLITGESGVGKELVALAIHQQSSRRAQPFLAVNCAGMPETLLESELFGHVKGSFTGAYRDRPGKLERADQGTVFLDEIGEMTLRMQGLLLRFLETGELQKVGADQPTRRVNVRVVAATNRNLRQLVAEKAFREDLFYRLNVIHVVVPTLAERRDDIAPLVEHYLGVFAADRGLRVTPAAMAALTRYSWPGNIRELVNIVERLVVTTLDDEIDVGHLPPEIGADPGLAGHRRERRRTVADELFRKLTEERVSFWSVVYPLYMQREITKAHVRQVVQRGLEASRGNYKLVAKLFNLEPGEYKRFLNFLRKHDCQLPFKEYRQ